MYNVLGLGEFVECVECALGDVLCIRMYTQTHTHTQIEKQPIHARHIVSNSISHCMCLSLLGLFVRAFYACECVMVVAAAAASLNALACLM